MKFFRCIPLLLLTAALARSQPPRQSQPTDPPERPEAVVRSLYREIISRTVGGIPKPAKMRILAPYLSKSLLRRIALARACGNDWYRQHPSGNVKPPFAWGEAGLFSGANDRTGPRSFQIETTEPQKDGSFRVSVRLKGGIPPEKQWEWEIAAVVVEEGGTFAINDVIYLKDKDVDEYRLSDLLWKGCEGTRWVGYRDK